MRFVPMLITVTVPSSEGTVPMTVLGFVPELTPVVLELEPPVVLPFAWSVPTLASELRVFVPVVVTFPVPGFGGDQR